MTPLLVVVEFMDHRGRYFAHHFIGDRSFDNAARRWRDLLYTSSVDELRVVARGHGDRPAIRCDLRTGTRSEIPHLEAVRNPLPRGVCRFVVEWETPIARRVRSRGEPQARVARPAAVPDAPSPAVAPHHEEAVLW